MQNLNSCGCCEGISVETPVPVTNRPGLTAISYRIGTHSQFKESMLAKLSSAQLTALRRLTTRSDDDFTIALLDAWATVSDVLTFYQERIANESYLRTATEQFSIVELARLIGYELRPGVAASTYLAFTIDEATLLTGQALLSGISTGAAELPLVAIGVGTKVQSVPEQDEDPQTYETIEKIEAKAEWNAMTPRLSQPQTIIIDGEDKEVKSTIIIKGTSNNLKKNDLLLIIEDERKYLKKIHRLKVDEKLGITQLDLKSSSISYNNDLKTIELGNNQAILSNYQYRTPFNTNIAVDLITGTSKLSELAALLDTQRWGIGDFKGSVQANKSKRDRPVLEDGIFVFKKQAAVFGYNAPKQTTYKENGTPELASEWEEWDLDTIDRSNKIYLDTTYEEILANSHIAVQKSNQSTEEATPYRVKTVATRTRTDYGISAKVTQVSIDSNENWRDGTNNKLSDIRSLTIHTQSEPLELAEAPITTNVKKDQILLSQLYLGLEAGKIVLVSGERSDVLGTHANEIKVLKEVYITNGYTLLKFEKDLEHEYIRTTVTINANVALATHGETVSEILGSGNASQAFQKFVLKQPPLTFVSAATPSGTLSTLEIRVNDILWKEVPSLYGQGADEHIYITRQNSEAQTTVTFGDGITGARLPTGQQNVKATYRKGIGATGLLNAYQISQLVTRPLNVKAVTNPLPTTGAQNQELLSDARANANLTIYTLDRIVSLQDYEDFASAFAGITKALATWTRCGKKRCVHLTVAGEDGAAVKTDSTLYKNLLAAIYEASVPDVRVYMDSYTAQFFQVEGKVQVHPDYISEKVLAAVEQTLKAHFSFDERRFGQAVTLSEAVSIMQNVDGVVAVDIDFLYKIGAERKRNYHLSAGIATAGEDGTTAAELLTITFAPLALTTFQNS